MQKWGKTVAGAQRWYCLKCNLTSTRKRPDTTRSFYQQTFKKWLTGTQSLNQLAADASITTRSLTNRFKPFWNDNPQPKKQTIPTSVLIIDACYLYSRSLVCLVVRGRFGVINWTFSDREDFKSWITCLESVKTPQVVVCDGHKGELSAVKLLWPEVKIQRCLVHVARMIRIRLTTKPKTRAGLELYSLSLILLKVRTRRAKRRWLRSLYQWERRYQSILTEKSRGIKPNGAKTWWYTHKNLRSARNHLKNSLPHLFTYIGHAEIPRTTNHLEGGINARLKELLHSHRGLIPERKMVLASYFLRSKQS